MQVIFSENKVRAILPYCIFCSFNTNKAQYVSDCANGIYMKIIAKQELCRCIIYRIMLYPSPSFPILWVWGTYDIVGVNSMIVCHFMKQFYWTIFVYGDILATLYYYRLLDRGECPILVDEVETGCQLTILTIVVGWRVGKPFEYYFLSCCHVLEFKFGRMIS